MSNNKNTGRGVYGKGYYIALILCAAAIGISGYLYYRNDQKTNENLQDVQSEQDELPVVATQSGNVAAASTEPQLSASTPNSASSNENSALKTAAPLLGDTAVSYAMDSLSYNETTRDWRVHNGIDITAEEGTPVLAAADGVVYTTYADDTMGTTVVIRHDGGYTTKYASLSEDLNVQSGDTVTLGQTIGTVGSTALIETAIGPHVHFSVTYRDADMDPVEFINMNN